MDAQEKRKPKRTTEMTLQLNRESIAELMRVRSGRQASFVVIGGMDVGETIVIKDDGATVLGRDADCDGVIRDDGISRHHAQVISEKPGEYVLVDLDSTNGVFVDGERISRRALSEGDKVLLGRRTILKFVVQDKLDMQFQKTMYESAVRDALTGAFNRKHFDERIASELSYSRRHAVTVTLAMLDIDHFKRINDTWGHQAGDQVLASVAKAISAMLRQEDVFARYGGEEFVVIARGIGAAGGLALGERVRAGVESIAIKTEKGERIPVTISVGVSTAPGGCEIAPAQIVRASDQNLYKAKETGRNRVVATELRIE
jgi:two-component system, cell cycle response regulator